MPGLHSSVGSGPGRPIIRSLGWSVSVVLVGGVAAALATPTGPGQTVLQQQVGLAVPADPVGATGPLDPAAPAGGPGAAPVATATTGAPATAPPPSAAPAPKAKSPGTTRPAARAAAAAPAPSAAAAAPRLQPAAGSYPLRIAGTSSVDGKPSAVPASGSLVVEGQGSDQTHRTVGVPGGLVVAQRASAAGIDVVSFSLTAAGKTLTFRPPAPLPFVRTDPGASWSWSARSSDGAVTVNQAATVAAAGAVSVGGTSVPVVTVNRTFTVSGSVQGTVRLTTSVSLVDRLPLVQQQSIDVKATVLGLLTTRVVSDATATLTSTSPR